MADGGCHDDNPDAVEQIGKHGQDDAHHQAGHQARYVSQEPGAEEQADGMGPQPETGEKAKDRQHRQEGAVAPEEQNDTDAECKEGE